MQQNFYPQQAPQPYQPMRPMPKNGLGTAALVLGIVGLVLSLIPFVSLFTAIPLGITGAILAIVGLARIGSGIAMNKVATIIGLVASILAILISLVSSVATGALIGSLGSGDGAGDNQSGVISTEKATKVAEKPDLDLFPGQTEDDIVGEPGDEIKKDGVTVKAAKLKTQDTFLGGQLCSKVTITNNGDSSVSYNSLDWKLQYPSGDIQDVSFAGDDFLSNGEIAPGGSTSGNVCFDASGEPGQYVLINEELFSFTSDRAVWVNNRK